MLRIASALSLLAFVSSCDGTVSVTFRTGPQEFEVSTAELALPDALRDGATIAALPCPMGICPPSDAVPLTCTADVCDPAPKTISAPGGIVDVEALLATSAEVGLTASRVDSYSFDMVSYEIALNTLTIPVDEIQVYWGPEAATAVDAPGVRLLGTVPPIGAGEVRSGQVAIDPAGEAALSDYLVGGGRSIRFFAQTQVDLDPGDPFPEGAVRVAVNLEITAVGSIL